MIIFVVKCGIGVAIFHEPLKSMEVHGKIATWECSLNSGNIWDWLMIFKKKKESRGIIWTDAPKKELAGQKPRGFWKAQVAGFSFFLLPLQF